MIETQLFLSLVAALDSPEEMTRLDAVYKLQREKRAIRHLIRVLGDQKECGRVRGQAAESLAILRKRKAIKPLVDASADPCPEVRFWCVFGLGCFVKRRGTPLLIVRALEQRLHDDESPDNRGNWWSVGLEALAMLRRCKKSRLPIEREFRETLLTVLRDPLNHRDKWRWADCYWNDCIARLETGQRSLYDAALLKIRDAGFDPVSFGQHSDVS
jgi:hypothetical protein